MPKQAVVEVDLASEAEKQKKRAERFGIPASLEVSVMKSFVKNWWRLCVSDKKNSCLVNEFCL